MVVNVFYWFSEESWVNYIGVGEVYQYFDIMSERFSASNSP